MSGLTEGDVTAMRRDGDLSGYVRSLIRPTHKDATTPLAATPAGFGPLHRPGAWPFGIHPPRPNTCHPDCGCAITPRTIPGTA